MRALLKFLAAVFGAILIFVIAALLLLQLLVNPNKYRDKINKQVYHLTGRLMTASHISWTVFPRLGIKATDVVLSNPVGLSKSMFASAKSAQISVEFIPLFHGHIQFEDLIFDGLTINLEKDAKGVNNWRDFATEYNLPDSNAAETANSNLTNMTPAEDNNKQIPVSYGNLRVTVSISGIKVTNGTINWTDLQKQTIFSVNHINFTSQDMQLNHPFPVTLSFRFDGTKPAFVGNINLKTKLLINKQQQSLTLQNLNLQASRISNQYPSGHLDVTLNSDVLINAQKTLTVSIPNLNASIANLQIKGNVQNEPGNTFQFVGKVQIPDFNARTFLNNIGKQSLNMKNSNVLQHCAANFYFDADKDGAQLKQLQLQLDGSHINGNLAINHYSTPQINFNLSADAIDINRYSSAGSNNTAQNTLQQSNTETETKIFPSNGLRQLNLNGSLSANTLHYSKFDFTGFSTQVVANAGLIKFNSLKAKIYQGQTVSNVTLDVRSATPRINLNTRLTGINIGQLLTDSSDITKIKIAGNGNLSANITASGNTSAAIKQSMNGNTQFSVANGVLYGVDIPFYSDLANALLHKQLPTRTNTGSTNFGTLTGTANINNGLMSNNDLSIQGTGISATGSGTANLVSEQLNYKIIMKQSVGDVPLIISGNFNHPSIKPDITEIMKSQVVKTLTKQLEKKIDGGKVTQQIENALGIGGQNNNQNNNQNQNNTNNSNTNNNENPLGGNVGKQLQQGLKSLLGQ